MTPRDICRVTRSHGNARAGYDRLSRWYDLIEGGWEGPPRREGLELLGAAPGEKLLEIGCGTGTSLLDLSPAVISTGLDLSAGMLAQTHKRLQKTGRTARLLQGDALYLPFPPGCFDVVFMAFVLDLIDTPEFPVILSGVRRILRRGGRLGIVSLSKMGGLGFMQRLYEWSHNHFPNAIDCRPIYARLALEEAGFSVRDYRAKNLTGLGVEVVVGIK